MAGRSTRVAEQDPDAEHAERERRPAAALSVRELEVVYQGVIRALRGVSVEVAPGETFAVLGGNGAGKTTLLRAVTGLLDINGGAVTGGGVELDGEPIAERDPTAIVRAGVAQVMEGRRIFAQLTVEENLRAGAFTRRDRHRLEESYQRIFSLFPVLAERRAATAGFLSGGEQQMLAIGRALMSEPRLLLLDEPSLGLAPALVGRIAGAIEEIGRQGATVLLVEQNANMALSVAARGVVLESGRVALQGSAAELRADPAVREAYLGGRQ